MKRIIGIICAFVLCMTAAGCAKEQTPQQESENLTGLHHAQIEVEGYGVIELELDADTAPITVANFMGLAKSGFYDGLTFHRVVPGFFIQGGDPKGNGTGDSDKKIKGEFLANGVDNPLKHERGVISMARLSDDMNSATCQFFIVQSQVSSLDGQYAAFGHVTSGMEIVDKICAEVPVADERSGFVAKENQPVITAVRIVD